MEDQHSVEQAVDALARDHGRLLLYLAYQLTHDRAAAQDLVQDSLLSVFETWQRQGAPTDESARLSYARITMVRRSARQAKRRTAERASMVRAEPTQSEVSSSDSTEMLAVWNAVGELRPDERAAVVLHYYLDMPHSEVAEHLACRIGTARSLCSRALLKIRQTLNTDYSGPTARPARLTIVNPAKGARNDV